MAKKSSRKKKKSKVQSKGLFERFSTAATQATGSSYAFIIALSTVIVWAVSGPVFAFSETWQLVINTGTTIVTFLMVFLIQKSQNKDSKAIQIKLNELIAAHQGASNRIVDIEELTEDELDQLHRFYAHLAHLARRRADITESHSIDAAEELTKAKAVKQRTERHKLADAEKALAKEDAQKAPQEGSRN